MTREVIVEHLENLPLEGASEQVWSYRPFYNSGRPKSEPKIILFGIGEKGYQEKSLSSPQFRVLQLVCDGAYNGEIARNLGLSVQTVKNQIVNLRKLLGIPRPAGRDVRNLILREVVDSGFVRFKPRIPEENWLGV